MIGITSRKNGLSVAALVVVTGAFLGSPARADRIVDVYIDNTDNRTVTVEATDVNNGSKIIPTASGSKTLKHNERWSGKMILDKDSNGHVKFEARAVDAKGCETRTYDAKQLSPGFAWSVSLKCN
jgi:hypothetical protein